MLPRSKTIILLFLLPFPDDQDFLFYPAIKTNLTLYTHIVNYKTLKVLVKNMSNWLVHILRQQNLGHIVDIHYDNCFLANAKSTFQSATVLPKIQPLFKQKPSLAPNTTKYLIETRLYNRIRVYRDTHIIAQLAQLLSNTLLSGNLKALYKYR